MTNIWDLPFIVWVKNCSLGSNYSEKIGNYEKYRIERSRECDNDHLTIYRFIHAYAKSWMSDMCTSSVINSTHDLAECRPKQLHLSRCDWSANVLQLRHDWDCHTYHVIAKNCRIQKMIASPFLCHCGIKHRTIILLIKKHCNKTIKNVTCLCCFIVYLPKTLHKVLRQGRAGGKR